MKTTTRLTAEERRADVVAAAGREFAARGYAGTSTQAIAERAGVSQPYLFQLFGTKKDLFIEAVHACFARTRSTFETTGRGRRADGADPAAILKAMGCSYHDLLRDRDMLRLQLHAYAACDDPDIRAVVRDEWTRLHEAVARVSGADPRRSARLVRRGDAPQRRRRRSAISTTRSTSSSTWGAPLAGTDHALFLPSELSDY